MSMSTLHSVMSGPIPIRLLTIAFVFLPSYYLAPVKEELERGIKVLDAGCGTGIWSLEMAKLYPASHFTGTDIVNVFEETIPKAPVNCNYEVANTLKGLPFQDGSFDYVFQRFQTGCFRKTEWPLVIAELIRVTKPGGWLELVDTQGTFFNAGPRTSDFHSRMVSMLSLRDIDLTWPANFKRVLEESGMEEIGGKMVSVPVGWGPKDVAKVSMANTEASYKSLKPSISVVMGLSDVDYDELIAGSLKEFVPYETYWNIDCVFSKKPVDGAAT
ncbi:S-adenosyl-L-methionine-dependent methyltransferase [Jimgerdemannia flammicorona]|uniref:S-adenosyl-L-methionine-dependent methyltransferase n=1 Tax=Jimgerdemannia flammicorona TaxID=994334 RepID=A0A433D2A1_9FUNG|nr:S-adenosyl-L-methionine-dependent methyltransferase [Jimgerdemannia flammicorona]